MTDTGTNVTNDDGMVVDDGKYLWAPAAWDAMLDILDSLRPWSDTDAVAHALAAWTRDFSSPKLDALDVYDGAERLARIGGAPNVPESEVMASFVLDMLRNTAAGREVDDYGTGFEHIEVMEPGRARFDPRGGPVVPGRPLPARTIRDYRERFGPNALIEWINAWQRRMTRGELVARGRTPQAARAWERRHRDRGTPARDAGPPRQPRG